MEDPGNQTQVIEPVVTETPTEPVTPVSEAPVTPSDDAFLEIKYNKESVKLDREKAAELAQKGMNYDKAIERAKQEARDAYFAEQGYTWKDKPITTEAEYKQALKEQELTEQYRAKNLPDDVIQELVESKKFREQYNETQRESADRAKVESDFLEFTKSFPDAKPEDIPTSVWADVNAGKSLVDAYTKFENQTLKQKLAAVEQAKQIEQQNNENAASSTGSVTGNGSNAPAFFTLEQVQKMSQSEVDKNYKVIMESQKKWYQ